MSSARRGGALRALVISGAIAFAVAYGGCVAYEATLRTELDALRAELNAEGAALDLQAFAETLERGDPRTGEFLEAGPEARLYDPAKRAALEARVAALGPLDLRGELEQAQARTDVEEGAFPTLDLPIANYMQLVNAITGEILGTAMASVSEGQEERFALAVRVIELMPGYGTLLTYQVRSTAEIELLNQLETVFGLLPKEMDLTVVETHLAELTPRARLERAYEGERAYGFTLLAQGGQEVLPDLPFGQDLQRLQLELSYLEAMRECFELIRLEWPEFQRRTGGAGGRGSLASSAQAIQALVPRTEDQLSTALELEARRDLALAALVARREGHAGAIAFLAQRRDPFTGAPYSAEVGADGFLRLASAGPDTVLANGEWSASREDSVDDPRWLLAPEASGE